VIPAPAASPELARLCVNTLKFLAVDAIEAAKSGHPGLPLGAADLAYVLWSRYLRHDPARPPLARPRPLSALPRPRLDAPLRLLHLSGYDLPLDELKRFRQWGSKTPGAPRGAPHPGRRGHHRAARAGLRQRRRHGPRGEDGRGALPRALRPPGVGPRLRRRRDGGRHLRGRLPRRPPQARQPHLRLRRQQDHPRRRHRRGLQRRRRHPLRVRYGWRAERVDGHDHDADPRGRLRPRHRARREAHPHPRPHDHRPRRAQQEQLAQGPRRAPRAGPKPPRRARPWAGSDETFVVPDAVRAHFAARAAEGATARAAWRTHEARWFDAHPERVETYRAMRDRVAPQTFCNNSSPPCPRPPTPPAGSRACSSSAWRPSCPRS
jgi:hypothetical protein